MLDSTSVLFGLEDEFVVASVERLSSGDLRVVIEHRAREAACPACGVVTSRVKDRPLVRVKDLPAFGHRVELWWRKRRLACREPACACGSFTQQSEAILARARLTTRLRVALAEVIASGNRAVDEVARAHGVSWPTANRAWSRPRPGGCPSRGRCGCSGSTRHAPGRCGGSWPRPGGSGPTRG